jgi:poly(3-hydroxyalkanoate) synthetase
MGAIFTWMRPNELVWNYRVNNYLMGDAPPAFDILAWNADGTNLPAALHAQFLEIFQDNVLCEPGRMTVLGTPVDLGRITRPTSPVASRGPIRSSGSPDPRRSTGPGGSTGPTGCLSVPLTRCQPRES